MSDEKYKLNKLCVHTITTKPLGFEEACIKYAQAGIKGITIWRDAIQNIPPSKVTETLRNNNLELVSYCRGGFFPHVNESKRIKAVEANKTMIREAASIQAPMIVLVCGAHPEQSLETSRDQIRDGIISCLPLAEELKVKLAIEPLHPMYADNRSAINTLMQANEMAEDIQSPWVGVAIDAYHVWWDPDLEKQIERCGRNENIMAWHICDWKTPTNDLLLDRELMGEGCIDLKKISSWMKQAGFNGFHEVEIFSEHYWSQNQDSFIIKISDAFLKYAS
jgi:sugar phosphate isomerase/epimerase